MCRGRTLGDLDSREAVVLHHLNALERGRVGSGGGQLSLVASNNDQRRVCGVVFAEERVVLGRCDGADDGSAAGDLGRGEGGLRLAGGDGLGQACLDRLGERFRLRPPARDGDEEAAGGLRVGEEETPGERDRGREEGLVGDEGDVVEGRGGVDGSLPLGKKLLSAWDERDGRGKDLRERERGSQERRGRTRGRIRFGDG